MKDIKKVDLQSKDVDYLLDRLYDILSNYNVGGSDSDEILAEFEKCCNRIGQSDIEKNPNPFDLESAKDEIPSGKVCPYCGY